MARLSILLLTAILACPNSLLGQLCLTQNAGQWKGDFAYRFDHAFGKGYVDKKGLTFYLTYGPDTAGVGHKPHSPPAGAEAIQILWETGGAAEYSGSQELAYPKYFYTTGSAKPIAPASFHRLKQQFPARGHSIHLYEAKECLEFDLVTKPRHAPLVSFRIRGARVSEKDGQLILSCAGGAIMMTRPNAYQVIDGKRNVVSAHYDVNGDMVTVKLPNGYDRNHELVIDPALVFASYSGSRADNWGATATYDSVGSAYLGGIAFENGFPTTPGVIQRSFNGISSVNRNTDISIMKFAPNGRTVQYATYLGGNQPEMPISLVCNANNELVILSVTGSANFPTTPGSFKRQFTPGPYVDPFGYGAANGVMMMNNGSDISITRILPDGRQIKASTYFGGAGADGINPNASPLVASYGDQFRGEVVADRFGNIYIASGTASSNMAAAGSYQTTFGGRTDALVAKFDSSLQLTWSTYLGGGGSEYGMGLRVARNGEVIVTGGTTNAGFPTTAGAFQPLPQNPINTNSYAAVDGFISRFSADGSQLLASTLVSSNDFDQSFLVDLDNQENILVCGQTKGALGFTPGKFGISRGGLFIQKYSPNLAVREWATQLGSSPGVVNITPSAFMVDLCGQVYLSGWGGSVGNHNGPFLLTTGGLPTTPNAIKTSTDGDDFYLAVFNVEMSSLKYATFYGGSMLEHVDGGTSRFDKRGVVYQAVCAGCGGYQSFPVTPGVSGPTNRSSNCNSALFKIDFRPLFSPLTASVTPDTLCAGSEVVLSHNGQNGQPFLADFGDSSFVTQFASQIRHQYHNSGWQQIKLLALAPDCPVRDSVFLSVYVRNMPVPPDSTFAFCLGDTIGVQVPIRPGDRLVWRPEVDLQSDTARNQRVTPSANRRYQITVSEASGMCSRTVEYSFITPLAPSINVSLKRDSCKGEELLNYSLLGNPATFQWSFGDGKLSLERSGTHIYDTTGSLTFQLDFTNGSCRGRIDSLLSLSNALAKFNPNVEIVPTGNDCVHPGYILYTEGKTDRKLWQIEGNAYYFDTDTLRYMPKANESSFSGYLIQQSGECADTSYFSQEVSKIQITNLVIPNLDGYNEKFEARNLLPPNQVRIYDRWGRQHLVQDNYVNTWPDKPIAPGTYYYTIRTASGQFCKGWVEVLK